MTNKTSILEELLQETRGVLQNLPDFRKKSNATKYDMLSAGIGAFAVFFMQDQSFLSNQIRLMNNIGQNNFTTLFGIEKIPSQNQIRNILDQVHPDNLCGLYDKSLEVMQKHGGLEEFKYLPDSYLIALDGVEYHSSQKVKCECCNSRTHKSATTYYHSMVASCIVSPDLKEAIPLIPEFISSNVEASKQDCENAGVKRWIEKHKERYRHLKPTFLGDDLYSKESICKLIIAEEMHFIFVCKPDSHKTLYEYLHGIECKSKSNIIKDRHKKYRYDYKYLNGVPIKDGKEVLAVNWIDVRITDLSKNKEIYHNSFITNHDITDDNVAKLAASGRARWKIENENNNTLKTKGYNFEHNYGHGKKHLSSVLASLILVAFLHHTIASRLCQVYIRARTKLGTRINFWNTLRTITSILVFASWTSLLTMVYAPPDRLSRERF